MNSPAIQKLMRDLVIACKVLEEDLDGDDVAELFGNIDTRSRGIPANTPIIVCGSSDDNTNVYGAFSAEFGAYNRDISYLRFECGLIVSIAYKGTWKVEVVHNPNNSVAFEHFEAIEDADGKPAKKPIDPREIELRKEHEIAPYSEMLVFRSPCRYVEWLDELPED